MDITTHAVTRPAVLFGVRHHDTVRVMHAAEHTAGTDPVVTELTTLSVEEAQQAAYSLGRAATAHGPRSDIRTHIPTGQVRRCDTPGPQYGLVAVRTAHGYRGTWRLVGDEGDPMVMDHGLRDDDQVQDWTVIATIPTCATDA